MLLYLSAKRAGRHLETAGEVVDGTHEIVDDETQDGTERDLSYDGSQYHGDIQQEQSVFSDCQDALYCTDDSNEQNNMAAYTGLGILVLIATIVLLICVYNSPCCSLVREVSQEMMKDSENEGDEENQEVEAKGKKEKKLEQPVKQHEDAANEP